MLRLGIETDGTDVYEGGGYLHAIYPPPILIPLALIASGDKIAPLDDSIDLLRVSFIFREDSFDPTARIKRGRVYRRAYDSQPTDCSVYPHPARFTEVNKVYPGAGVLSKRLATFSPHRISVALKEPVASQPLVLLGTAQAYSLWLIVDIEQIYTGEELLTLRAIRSFGALPNLKPERLPESNKSKLVQTAETLGQEIHRASPGSVIDRSRDLISVSIAAYLETKGVSAAHNDLGDLIKELDKLADNDRRLIVSNAAKIVSLLHARGKPSEQEKRPIRRIMEQDAELAVSCVGVTLCDFGWAEWT